MIEFFMHLIPPTSTAQMQQVSCKSGKPIFYDPPEVKQAKAKFLAHLGKHKPDEAFKGAPLRLTTKWLFPTVRGRKNGQFKHTKPDTDNLQKLLKDCMTKAGFWEDDALVASEIVEKFWADVPGIYIKIEELNCNDN